VEETDDSPEESGAAGDVRLPLMAVHNDNKRDIRGPALKARKNQHERIKNIHTLDTRSVT